MKHVVKIDGHDIRTLQNDEFDSVLKKSLGLPVRIARWSNVEYNNITKCWQIYFEINGKEMWHGAWETRSAAIEWERQAWANPKLQNIAISTDSP